jgi:hypothetical protein
MGICMNTTATHGKVIMLIREGKACGRVDTLSPARMVVSRTYGCLPHDIKKLVIVYICLFI